MIQFNWDARIGRNWKWYKGIEMMNETVEALPSEPIVGDEEDAIAENMS